MKLVVDTSVLIAILRAEHDSSIFVEHLGSADARLMSAASYVEAAVVLMRRREDRARLTTLVELAEIEIVPVLPNDAEHAIRAYEKFGRGTGHPADLNYGDCFAYALAKSRNLPLLFKGSDFVHTDVTPALGPV